MRTPAYGDQPSSAASWTISHRPSPYAGVRPGRAPPSAIRKVEGEAGAEETPGNDSSALQGKLGVGPEEESADLDHPLHSGEPEARTPCCPKHGHEVRCHPGITIFMGA